MDINRLRSLAGMAETTQLAEDGDNEIMSHLEGLLEQIPEMGFDDDIEEGIQAAIMQCMGQIEELISEVAFTGRDSMSYMNDN